MKRSRLRNKFLKTRSSNSQKAYNKQRNFYLCIVKKVKRECNSKLDIKNVIGNIKLWNAVKPFLSDKTKKTRLTLVEKDEMVPHKKELCEIFNGVFCQCCSKSKHT